MKTIFELALSSIKNRKKRFLPLWSGMVFCFIFVTAVSLIGKSINYTLSEKIKDKYGEQKVIAFDLEEKDLEKICENPFWSKIGKVYTIGNCIPEKMFIPVAIGYMDETALELSRYNLIEGRMPLKTGEIVLEGNSSGKMLSSTLLNLSGKIIFSKSVKVGQDIEVSISDEKNKEKGTTHKKYKVVGILNNSASSLKSSLTRINISNEKEIFMPLSGLISKEEFLSHYNKNTPDLFLYCESMDLNQIMENLSLENSESGYALNNRSYLEFTDSRHNFNDFIVEAFVYAISIGLFLVMGLFIFNLTIMSVQKRSKQMRLLRCIGGTRKQGLWLIIIETAILGILAIPVGTGIGVGVYALLTMIKLNYEGVTLLFYMDYFALIINAIVGFVIIILSVLIPGLKAGRISPLKQCQSNCKKSYNLNSSSRILPSPLGLMRISIRNNKLKVFITCICFGICFALINGINSYFKVSNYGLSNIYDFRLVSGTGLHIYENGYVDLDKKNTISKYVYDKVINYPEKKEVRADVIPSMQVFLEDNKYKDYVDDKVSVPTIKMYSETTLKNLNQYVIEGRIDIDALNRGDEILFCMPPYRMTINGAWANNRFYRYDSPFYPINAKLYKNSSYHAGDEILFKWADNKNAQTHTKKVKIGAIVNWGYPLEIISTKTAMDKWVPYEIVLLDFNFENKDLSIETLLFIDSIAGTTKNHFFSRWEEGRNHESLSMLYIGISILFSFVIGSVGLINLYQIILARVRNRRHEVILLRSIGMTKGQIYTMFLSEGAVYGVGSSVIGFVFTFIMAGFLSNSFSISFAGPQFWIYTLSTPLLLSSICLFSIIPVLFMGVHVKGMLVELNPGRVK